MACGKPPKPGSISVASPVKHPVASRALSIQKELENDIKNAKNPSLIDQTVQRAEKAIKLLARTGASQGQIKQLNVRLEKLKNAAQNLASKELGNDQPITEKNHSGRIHPTSHAISEDTQKKYAPSVRKALETDDHFRSKQTKENLIDMVGGSQIISQAYKDQLYKDVSKILKSFPTAGGLLSQLTDRGQRGATGSRAKLGNRGNTGIGTAYELMGTAALINKASWPLNSAPRLSISNVTDMISFGEKSYINSHLDKNDVLHKPTRKTIESDLKILRKTPDGIREIGVDFKHRKEMGTTNSSKDFRNQVDNVVKAMQHGELHEFHFVTNGKFSGPYKECIDKANQILIGSHNDPIGYHEYVSSLPSST
jgi:hypothetical protein